jgi:hypothetical protein
MRSVLWVELDALLGSYCSLFLSLWPLYSFLEIYGIEQLTLMHRHFLQVPKCF